MGFKNPSSIQFLMPFDDIEFGEGFYLCNIKPMRFSFHSPIGSRSIGENLSSNKRLYYVYIEHEDIIYLSNSDSTFHMLLEIFTLAYICICREK